MYEGLDEELGDGFPKPADQDLMEKNKLIMECMKDLVKSLGKASIVVDIAKIIAICGYHPKKKQDERKS